MQRSGAPRTIISSFKSTLKSNNFNQGKYLWCLLDVCIYLPTEELQCVLHTHTHFTISETHKPIQTCVQNVQPSIAWHILTKQNFHSTRTIKSITYTKKKALSSHPKTTKETKKKHRNCQYHVNTTSPLPREKKRDTTHPGVFFFFFFPTSDQTVDFMNVIASLSQISHNS